MDLELIVANLSSQVVEKTMGGRQYLVAPVSMLVQGVHNGSRGRVYYPSEVLAKNVAAWNMMPITLEHPEGKSARNPEIIEEKGLGFIFNAGHNGKLRAEAWFDIEITQQKDPTLLNDLRQGRQVEVSTGLFPVLKDGEGLWNGEVYSATLTAMYPDHLAVIRNGKGACSLLDGCGLLNEEGEETTGTKENFWTQFLEFVTNKKGGAVGGSPTTPKEEPTMALSAERKKEIVDSLINNCDCYAEKDRENLTNLEDDSLISKFIQLNEEVAIKNKKASETVLAQATKPIKVGDNLELVFNAEKNEWEKKEITPALVQNAETAWGSIPPEIQAKLDAADRILNKERTVLIDGILANVEDSKKEAAKAVLNKKSLTELEELSLFAPQAAPRAEYTPSYEGAGGSIHNRYGNGEEVEFDRYDTIPVLNYAEDLND